MPWNTALLVGITAFCRLALQPGKQDSTGISTRNSCQEERVHSARAGDDSGFQMYLSFEARAWGGRQDRIREVWLLVSQASGELLREVLSEDILM